MSFKKFNEIVYNYVLIGVIVLIFLFKSSSMSAFEVIVISFLMSFWYNLRNLKEYKGVG